MTRIKFIQHVLFKFIYIAKSPSFKKVMSTIVRTKLNRTILQSLAYTRLDEARILLDNGKYDGAYYLSGYVIELALKARIAKLTDAHDFPDKKFVNDNHTHELSVLLTNSELKKRISN